MNVSITMMNMPKMGKSMKFKNGENSLFFLKTGYYDPGVVNITRIAP